MRKFLESHHANHCPKREVSCPNCKEVGAYSFITSDEHIDECPDATVPCPNEGCGKKMYRKLLQSHIKVCPKEIISCSYSIAGCCVTTTREAVMEHEHQFTQEHLHIALDHIQQQDTKIQQQDTKIQEQDTVIQNLNTKIQQQDAQIQTLKQETTHIIFSITDFQATCKKKLYSYSPFFYVPSNGYKMYISVAFTDVNHLGFFMHLQQGDYDNMLEWPFRGEVAIELLNQLDDKNHYKGSVTFDSSVPRDISGRPTSGSNHGWGKPKFINYSDLSAAYLQNDTVFFRVKVAIHSKVKSWLSHRLLTST